MSVAITSADFERCHPITAGWEGGWSNHKADPGGKTMYGITEAVFWTWLDSKGQKRRPVRSITKAEALQIYFTNYWTKAGCEGLVPGVDLAVYDASVNSGVSRGRKWLLASLDKKNNHAQTVKNICKARLSFVQSLINWKHFGNGWGNRIADIQAKGVAMALAYSMKPSAVSDALDDEARAKAATAKKQAAGAATSGVGGSGAVVLDPTTTPPAPAEVIVNQAPAIADWLLTGLGVGLFVLAVYFIWRTVQSNQQSKAFAREAEVMSHVA